MYKTHYSIYHHILFLSAFALGSSTGIIALMEIPKQKCYFIFRHPVVIVTSMDSYPKRWKNFKLA